MRSSTHAARRTRAWARARAAHKPCAYPPKHSTQDGTIGYEIKLTGELSTNNLSAGEGPNPTHGTLVMPGVNAQHHQHMCVGAAGGRVCGAGRGGTPAGAPPPCRRARHRGPLRAATVPGESARACEPWQRRRVGPRETSCRRAGPLTAPSTALPPPTQNPAQGSAPASTSPSTTPRAARTSSCPRWAPPRPSAAPRSPSFRPSNGLRPRAPERPRAPHTADRRRAPSRPAHGLPAARLLPPQPLAPLNATRCHHPRHPQIDAVPMPVGPDNPSGMGFVAQETKLLTTNEAQRRCNFDAGRIWKARGPARPRRRGAGGPSPRPSGEGRGRRLGAPLQKAPVPLPRIDRLSTSAPATLCVPAPRLKHHLNSEPSGPFQNAPPPPHPQISNPNTKNPMNGSPVAYKLVPMPSPPLMAAPGSYTAKRAVFAPKNL
jgi:hypothetical protein